MPFAASRAEGGRKLITTKHVTSALAARFSRKRASALTRVKLLLLLWLVPFCLLSSPASALMETELTVGILSLRPKEVTQQTWQPLMNELSKKLPGYRFRLKVLEHWEMRIFLREHLLDFVLTNPSHYIAMRQEHSLSGALATLITKEGEQQLKAYGGVIFTRAEQADIAVMQDLKGRRIACIGNDGSVLGGYQAQALELLHSGIPLPTAEQLLITGLPQDRVIEAVLEGKAEAGFVRTGMIEQLAAQGKIDAKRLKIINRQEFPGFPHACSTRLYPEWPFVAMPHVDEELAREVASVLLRMEPGSAVMSAANIHGFGIPADYMPVESLMRELRLPPYDIVPHFTLTDIWTSYRWRIVGLLGAGGVISLLTGRLLAMNRRLHKARSAEKSARLALMEREQHYRALVNTLPHGITVMDQDHRIVTINDTQARWYRQPPEWFIGRYCYEAFENREQSCPGCLGVVSMKTWEGCHGETVAVREDGRQVDVRLYTTPYFQANGMSSGFVKVVEDITEDKRFAASAQQMARLASLGEMASGVAHEINNPVSGIIGCAELMRTRLEPGNSCHAIIDRIIREGDRIAGIVNSLLSVAHPGQGRQEDFPIGECLGHVMVLFHSKLAKSGIDVAVDVPEDLPPLNGDRQKIEQLLLNLISNAYHALDTKFPDPAPDKRMSINASYRKTSGVGKLCLEVYDRGHGIPRDIIGKVFDPFFTTKPAGSGTGLGLGICYEIVKQFGGDIRVESEVGQFTRVMVELPAEMPFIDSTAGKTA